jgi:O-antigen ligase
MVRHRETKLGLIILFSGLAIGTAAHFLMPDSARRMINTVSSIQNTEEGDIRIDIYSNALRAGISELPLGAGVGDGQDVLAEYYKEDGHDWPDLNTHNIFLDSLLSLGLPGLLLLLAMLALPTVDGYRRRDFELLTLMLTIAICGMFESILSRQMGLMFIVPMWYAIASSSPCLQTDSKDSQ